MSELRDFPVFNMDLTVILCIVLAFEALALNNVVSRHSELSGGLAYYTAVNRRLQMEANCLQ